MTITYAALSLYPLHQRERILQDWLVQFAWELIGDAKIEEPTDPAAGSNT